MSGQTIVNVMTVDVEDYFQVSAFEAVVSRDSWHQFESRVCANTERLLAIFDDAGVHGTFFVLGWIGHHFPELVRRIASLGHEIASHSYAHRLVYDMTPDEFRDDLRRARAVLESAGGAPVQGFRAPSYSITARSLWAVEILIEEGYRYDASIFPIYHDRYGIPWAPRHPHLLERSGGSILEAPASTIRLGAVNVPVAGGGYFRILPYAWTRWGIARLNGVEHKPAIVYLHPWEIDPDQPRLGTGRVSRFRHYRNLHRTEGRLRQLLRDFRFAPMTTVLKDVARESFAETPATSLDGLGEAEFLR